MDGITELRDMGVQFGPFDGPVPVGEHRDSPFRSSWRQTCKALARELNMLNAQRAVCELALTAGHWRNDGLPRADARAYSPAVRISFDSKWGPLRYETAEFWHWQDNVRAVALSMEALRQVDRYGVSKRGEQYRGWRALPMSTSAEDSIVTSTQAEAVIERYGSLKNAIRKTHPDQGGNEDEFRKVMKAREILGI